MLPQSPAAVTGARQRVPRVPAPSHVPVRLPARRATTQAAASTRGALLTERAAQPALALGRQHGLDDPGAGRAPRTGRALRKLVLAQEEQRRSAGRDGVPDALDEVVVDPELRQGTGERARG